MSVDGRLRNGLSREAAGVDVDVDRFLEGVITRGKRRQLIRRIGAVTIVAALIGVGAAVSPAVLDVIRHQRDQTAVPVPPGSEAIEGTYVVRIQRADAADLQGAQGLWQFTLRADGLLNVIGPPDAGVSAPSSQYQVEGDRILTTAFASDRCSGVGVYRWQREGSILTFVRVSDACALRVVLFTSHPWERG